LSPGNFQLVFLGFQDVLSVDVGLFAGVGGFGGDH
jgi:hypothetical protein